jgi:hypothetical protein
MMKIETVAKAAIVMARRHPQMSAMTHVAIEAPRRDYILSFKLDRNAKPDDLSNPEKIELEVFTDGDDDYLLIGYGPETDTLVIAECQGQFGERP